MATQNFTTYTEYDEGSDVSITSSRVTGTAVHPANQTAYVYKDMGASHFAGDFEHLFTMNLTNASWVGGLVNCWAVSDTIGDYYYDRINGYVLGAGLTKATYNYGRLLEGYPPDNSFYDISAEISTSTSYYCKVVRDEGVGTYGTLYLYMYTDAARTSLFDTLSLALHSKEDLRYLYALQTNDSGGGDTTVSFYTENLDLQESTAQAVGGGSVSIAAAVNKTTKKGLSGAVTIASTLGRTIKKGVAGTVTIAASLGRKISKAVGAGALAIASTVSIGSLIQQAVGDGAVAIASALNLIVKLGLSGTVTLAATLGRKVSTSLSGAITPSGALSSKTKLAIGYGSIAISSTLGLLIKKGVSGTVTIAATLGRKVYKAVSGALTPSGTVGRKIFKGLGDGTVTPASTLGLKIKLAVGSGSITAVGALTINLLRKLSAFLSFRKYRDISLEFKPYKTVLLDFKPYRDIDLTIRGG